MSECDRSRVKKRQKLNTDDDGSLEEKGKESSISSCLALSSMQLFSQPVQQLFLFQQQPLPWRQAVDDLKKSPDKKKKGITLGTGLFPVCVHEIELTEWRDNDEPLSDTDQDVSLVANLQSHFTDVIEQRYQLQAALSTLRYAASLLLLQSVLQHSSTQYRTLQERVLYAMATELISEEGQERKRRLTAEAISSMTEFSIEEWQNIFKESNLTTLSPSSHCCMCTSTGLLNNANILQIDQTTDLSSPAHDVIIDFGRSMSDFDHTGSKNVILLIKLRLVLYFCRDDKYGMKAEFEELTQEEQRTLLLHQPRYDGGPLHVKSYGCILYDPFYVRAHSTLE